MRPNLAALFFLLIFFMASFKLSYCIGNNSIFCPEIEKQALLSFKQSLEDPSNLLSSWNAEVNCCKWKVCYDRFQSLRGKINPSLLNLKHLRYLDLSQNNFEETIPFFIGSLTSLEYLDLSYAGFHGTIPHNIGNLSNLHTLSLGDSSESLKVDSLEWLSGLSQLEHLNMNYVNLSKAASWVQVINTLPSLVKLHFGSCRLNFKAPLNDVNITSLEFLDLSGNNFQSFAIPRWIFQLSKLLFLDLSYNSFQVPIHTISNTTKLQHIDLSGNYFNSTIPDWLYFCKDLEFVSLSYSFLHGTISNAIANLSSLNSLDLSMNELSGKIPREIANFCKIQKLDLSENKLQGEISDSFGNMSDCFLGALEYLSLEENQLSGHLTDQFGEFKSLQTIDLSSNSLSGAIPINLGKLSSLQYLRLDVNKLTGNLPESLGQLFNLENLFIRDNMLEGVVTESHFVSLTKLNDISASGNHLTLKVSPNWIPPFKLETLGLGSWNLGTGSRIPSWLETQKNIMELDLASTGISGNVPSWIWEIRFLNLSHNQLHGKIPDISGPEDGPRLIYLSSNHFSGSLPRVANTVTELDLSNNSFSGGISHFLCDTTNRTYRLEILHLGGNQLTGELPDCWMKWPSLTVLNLGNNNMSGSIPYSIGSLAHLQSLNLYSNKFSGQIPFSMQNCTKLVKIDFGDNDIDGNIPTWVGTSLSKLRILILRSNKLSGEISSDVCHLNTLQILDVSDNKFSGIIPRCVNNFTAMATKRSLADSGSGELDYSYYIGVFIESASVSIKGSELMYDTILSLVTNIDLSMNNLSGDIPKELTSLVELRSLNLSGNHLTGLIPDSIGDMKQLESLDFSRNFLSGEIPNSFTVMTPLNYLNLPYNNLTGRIPESTQLLGMDASSFIGNNLCGPPLTSNCSYDDKAPGPTYKEDSEGDKSKIEWFYVFLSLGYAVGFSAVCTTLVFKKSWREAYFGLLENMWNKLYVYCYIKWTRLTKPSGRIMLSIFKFLFLYKR
ncbi:hypothetical protein Pfo_017805 [Paulownia fortunei]|nr:hypothetical protein Pfo_017805 [Paulownia fortunei]